VVSPSPSSASAAITGGAYEDGCHGTRALGVVAAGDQTFTTAVGRTSSGTRGIAPQLPKAYFVSDVEWSKTSRGGITPRIAAAITDAIALTAPGDVILLEAQWPVSSTPSLSIPAGVTCASMNWPVETELHAANAIKLAALNGRIVIEPAGNTTCFDSDGNPYPLAINIDGLPDPTSSAMGNTLGGANFGAILVGGCESNLYGRQHQIWDHSNYGNRVKVFGWAEDVAAPAGTADEHYDPGFSGTSSASAMVAGLALLIQCMLRAAGKPDLSPARMQSTLETGTAVTPKSSTSPIGSLPDLAKILTKSPF
jgi:hypothetical protein